MDMAGIITGHVLTQRVECDVGVRPLIASDAFKVPDEAVARVEQSDNPRVDEKVKRVSPLLGAADDAQRIGTDRGHGTHRDHPSSHGGEDEGLLVFSTLAKDGDRKLDHRLTDWQLHGEPTGCPAARGADRHLSDCSLPCRDRLRPEIEFDFEIRLTEGERCSQSKQHDEHGSENGELGPPENVADDQAQQSR